MVIFKNNEGRNVAFWVFVCVKLLLPDEDIVSGDMWVQACSECIVAKLPRMAGVLSEWQGCSDEWRNVNKSWCSLPDRGSTA